MTEKEGDLPELLGECNFNTEIQTGKHDEGESHLLIRMHVK